MALGGFIFITGLSILLGQQMTPPNSATAVRQAIVHPFGPAPPLYVIQDTQMLPVENDQVNPVEAQHLPWDGHHPMMVPQSLSPPLVVTAQHTLDWLTFPNAISMDKQDLTYSKTTSRGSTIKTRRIVGDTARSRGSNRPRRPQAHSPIDFPPADSTTNETNTVSSRRLNGRKKVVCYYGTWAVYRPNAGKYSVEDIDPFLCTHVIYGFTGLSFDNMIKPLDPWNDLDDNYGKGAMRRFTNLKRLNPDLKTLVAIGGWNEGSVKYSKMASEPDSRARFVESCVKFLQKHNFDGLDLDWEYPGSRGGGSADKQNYIKLLAELKEAFRPHDFLLTAAVSAGKSFIEPAYDIKQVSKYLDLINLMTYDYHGGWETKTGLNAPLFHSPKYDIGGDNTLNVNWSVNYWLRHGAPADKIMLGVGSYGRSFTLDKAENNGINSPASQRGQAGPYTREPGSLGYNEICEFFDSQPNSWTVVRDPDYMTPYAYNGRLWVGYDDQVSLALKTQYAKSMGLGGVMMWSIETDDFHGKCHGEKYPLLNTIKRVLNNQPALEPQGNKPRPTSTTKKPQTFTSSTTSTIAPDREIEDDTKPPRPSSSTTKRPSRPTTPDNHKTTKAPGRRKPQATKRPTTSTTSTTTTTTTTSTSTTTQRPTGSSSKNPFVCRNDGMFADPVNCRKFIRCVSQAGSHYTMFKFDCAPGTAFSEELQLCDHIHNVPNCRQPQQYIRPILWNQYLRV